MTCEGVFDTRSLRRDGVDPLHPLRAACGPATKFQSRLAPGSLTDSGSLPRPSPPLFSPLLPSALAPLPSPHPLLAPFDKLCSGSTQPNRPLHPLCSPLNFCSLSDLIDIFFLSVVRCQYCAEVTIPGAWSQATSALTVRHAKSCLLRGTLYGRLDRRN